MNDVCSFFKHVGLNNRNSSNTIGFFQPESWIMLKVKDVFIKRKINYEKTHLVFFENTS